MRSTASLPRTGKLAMLDEPGVISVLIARAIREG
jgi:hypothetical protein